jgi:hypothetical protein
MTAASKPDPESKPAILRKGKQDQSAILRNDRDWWRQPVEGWPYSLTIRNIASGVVTDVPLRVVFDDEEAEIERAERALARFLQPSHLTKE